VPSFGKTRLSTSIYKYKSPWRWRQHGLLTRWYPATSLDGVKTQKTSTWNVRVVKVSKLAWGLTDSILMGMLTTTSILCVTPAHWNCVGTQLPEMRHNEVAHNIFSPDILVFVPAHNQCYSVLNIPFL